MVDTLISPAPLHVELGGTALSVTLKSEPLHIYTRAEPLQIQILQRPLQVVLNGGGAGSGGGVRDHQFLLGLTNDHHPQYHTDSRGDARYYTRELLELKDSETFSSYVMSGLQTSTPADTLEHSFPSGTALLLGKIVQASGFTATFTGNKIRDYWLNSDGTYTTHEVAASAFTDLPRYTDKLHIWRVQTDTSKITSVFNQANDYPERLLSEDRARTINQFIETFHLPKNTPAWASSTSYVFGDLYRAPNGNIYQVQIGGTSGTTAPTTDDVGLIADGTCQVVFFTKAPYEGAFRWAVQNGMLWYLQNIGLLHICHRITSDGTFLKDLVKDYLLTAFLHLITTHKTSSAYSLGMKVTANGWIWEATTAGTAASSQPFTAAAPHTLGQTVTDGSVTWKAAYPHYGSHDWFWMDTERDFSTLRSPDSHDSYAATFLQVLARYMELTDDYTWIDAFSPQTGYSYRQILTALIQTNLITQLSPRNLTIVFQNSINPKDGSSFSAEFCLDNCETYSGFKAAAYIFAQLGDSINEGIYNSYATSVSDGIYAHLFAPDYGFFKWEYSVSAAAIDANDAPLFYPDLLPQFFVELHQLPYRDAIFQSARLWASKKWTNWWSDNSKDTFPSLSVTFVAAKYWQDHEKALAGIRNAERFHMLPEKGTLYITEFAYYLRIKELLIAETQFLHASEGALYYSNHLDQIQKIDHGFFTGLDADDHPQYHTDARALTWLGTRSTSDLPEGSNLYYTDERAQDAVGAMAGTSLVYMDGTPSFNTVQDIRTTASPAFAGATLSGVTASRALTTNGSSAIEASATTATELGYVSGVTSSIQTQLNNKQPLDATLTALAAYNTNGILTQTAADTFTGRTITGTANQVTVTNGNGVSGNPTLSLPQDIATSSTPTFGGVYAGFIDANGGSLTITSTGSGYIGYGGSTNALYPHEFYGSVYTDSTFYGDGSGLTGVAADAINFTVGTTQGGTGLTSYAQGDILYASATNTLAKLAKSTTATRYLANTGSSNNPAWAQINLANGVTGQLPLANGGTGANLTDPNADRILFWDDSAGAMTWLATGNSLAITTTTLDTIQDIRTTASPTFNAVTLNGTIPLVIDPATEWWYNDQTIFEYGNDSGFVYDGTPVGLYWSNGDFGNGRFELRTQGGTYMQFACSYLSATSGGTFGSSSVTAGSATLTSQLSLGSVATQGVIDFNSTTANRIQFGTNGVAAPGASSAGMKIKLFGSDGVMAVSDYAIGIESGGMWFNTDSLYSWYRDSSTRVMHIDASGRLGVGSSTSLSALLDVQGTSEFNDDVTFVFNATGQQFFLNYDNSSTGSDTPQFWDYDITATNFGFTHTGVNYDIDCATNAGTIYGFDVDITSSASSAPPQLLGFVVDLTQSAGTNTSSNKGLAASISSANISNGAALYGSISNVGTAAMESGKYAGYFDGTVRISGSGLNLILSDSVTNAANKFGSIAARHYTNAEEPLGVLLSYSSNTEGLLRWGGGNSAYNAATRQEWYWAGNSTTQTGTLKMWLGGSNGGLVVNTSSTGTPAMPFSVEATSGDYTYDEAGICAGTNVADSATAHIAFMGYNDSTDYGFIDAVETSSGYRNFCIVPNGGFLVVGNPTNADQSAKLAVQQQTVGNTVLALRSEATNDDVTWRVRHARAATTDATVTTISTFSTSSNVTYYLKARVLARRTGGVSGSTSDSAAYEYQGCFRNNAGTLAQVGSTSYSLTAESQAGWNADFSVSGTNVLVRVTGAANNNVTWHLQLEWMQLSS